MGVYTNMRDAAKLRVGRVAQVELSDDEIWLNVVPFAVREWSNHLPRVGYHTLSLADGQNIYELPNPRIIEVTEWSDINEDEIATTILGDDYVVDAGIGFYYSTPLLADYARELARGSQVDTVNVKAGQIEVIPTPEGVVQIFMRTLDMWNLPDEAAYDAFPVSLIEPFTCILAACLADNLAAEALRIPEVRIGSNVTKINWKGLQGLAESERKAALSMIDSDELQIHHE